jgi:hypothetical protein
VERFFKSLKWKFLRGKVNKRIEHLIDTLVGSVSTYFCAQVQLKISGIKFNWKQVDSAMAKELKAEAICAEQAEFIKDLDVTQGTAKVKSSSQTNVWYEVNVPGTYCECPDASGILCKHIRAVAR